MTSEFIVLLENITTEQSLAMIFIVGNLKNGEGNSLWCCTLKSKVNNAQATLLYVGSV